MCAEHQVAFALLNGHVHDRNRWQAGGEPGPAAAAVGRYLDNDRVTGIDAARRARRVADEADRSAIHPAGDALEIGATTTFSELRADPLVRAHAPRSIVAWPFVSSRVEPRPPAGPTRPTTW